MYDQRDILASQLAAVSAQLAACKAERDEVKAMLIHATNANLAFNVKASTEINQARQQRDEAQREFELYRQGERRKFDADREGWHVLNGQLRTERDQLRAEVERMRKLFNDAGQGEHNVLALIDYYQERTIEAEKHARSVTAEVQRMRGQLAQWEAIAERDHGKPITAGHFECSPSDTPETSDHPDDAITTLPRTET